MRSECSENLSLQNYGRTMSPTQLCARSRTRLQDTWCHIAIHIYTSLAVCRLASGTKQGWGYVVVVFTVAILISEYIWTSSSASMFFRQTGQTRFQTSDHGKAARPTGCYTVVGYGWTWRESTALAGCLDLAKVRAAAAAPANHSTEQISTAI